MEKVLLYVVETVAMAAALTASHSLSYNISVCCDFLRTLSFIASIYAKSSSLPSQRNISYQVIGFSYSTQISCTTLI